MRAGLAWGVIAAVAVLTVEAAAGPDQPWIVEPGPEAPDAAERGAADVAKAQQLARKKRLPEAVAILERVVRAHPSAAHDCNLSLAYLRAGDLTRAQLMWDLARLRRSTPPAWCTSSLAAELATALRDRGYVPLTINVTPPDAVVTVGEISVRSMYLLWLPAGTHAVAARAAELVDQTAQVAVAPPSARVTITLEPPKSDEPAPAPSEPTPIVAPLPAPEPVALPPRDVAPPPAARPPVWPVWVGIGVGGAALATGAIFHAQALSTKDDANQLPSGSSEFADANDRFGRQRALAIGGYAVGAAAAGFAAWWWFGHRGREPARTVGVTVGNHGAIVTVQWSLQGTP